MSKQSETITFIPIEKLIPFRDHPFQIRDDEQMKMITDSIRSVGVLVPAIARPLPDGAYELISGHRRERASEILGLRWCAVSLPEGEAYLFYRRQQEGRT